jgi:hypothetical protein
MLARDLLLTQAIVAQERTLRFRHNGLLGHERDILVARNRKKQAKTEIRVGLASVRQNAFDDWGPVAHVGPVNYPWQ